MRYLSLFSGIEAATVAWHPLGWTPVAFAEIEPFPCSVLAHHYPTAPNLGDVTKITDDMIAALGPIDVVIGGSPCQDLSVAGKRAGLGGERSSLFHEQVRIFHAARHFCGARWLLWENVPGAFSTHGGRDFACVVSTLAGCDIHAPREGWGCEGVAVGLRGFLEWCVLDAQWFGVAQRRERVFAVLDAGNWQDRPPVLLEPESLRGDHPPRREAGQIAPTIPARRTSGGGLGTDFDCDGGLQVAHALRADGFDASEPGMKRQTYVAFSCKDYGADAGEVAPTLRSMNERDGNANAGGQVAVAFNWQSGGDGRGLDPHPVASALSRQQTPATLHAMQVRRLTPRECERLQGFPDDYTQVPQGKKRKPAKDGPRYKALGNSMATPVIAWIGRQIERAHTWQAAA